MTQSHSHPLTRPRPMPGSLKETLGTEQSLATLAAIAALPLLGVALYGRTLVGGEVALWRQIVAGLIALDIAAGAVANLTSGTNAYYAARPRARWVFIAIHLHLPLVALALGWAMGPILAIWAYTLAATSVVVALGQRRVVGGGLFLGGLIALPLAAMPAEAMALSALFLFKLVYSFGVDHDR